MQNFPKPLTSRSKHTILAKNYLEIEKEVTAMKMNSNVILTAYCMITSVDIYF